jgi:hypothetical protein
VPFITRPGSGVVRDDATKGNVEWLESPVPMYH